MNDQNSWMHDLFRRMWEERYAEADPTPDWQTAKIDAACDFWEMQMMGIRL